MLINLSLKTNILIFLILISGTLLSWFDIKKRIIPNKIIIPFLSIGITLNLLNKIPDFRINYLINILFAFFIGFFLWFINFWNAADGKLFLTFTSLLPIELFFIEKTQLYSYNLVIYTFVPIFFVFIIIMFFQIRSSELLFALKESMKPKIILNIFVAFFSFQWIIQIINSNYGLRLNFFINVLILFFIFESLKKVLKFKLINLFYITAVLRVFIDINNIFSLNFIYYFISQLAIFIIVVYFFIHIAYFKFGVHVKISNLQPGMNLCEKIIKKENKYTVIPNINISLFMFLRDKTDDKSVIEIRPEGLTKKEINMIQTWNKARKMEVGALLIQKRIPYAPFQFLGVIIFIITKLINL